MLIKIRLKMFDKIPDDFHKSLEEESLLKLFILLNFHPFTFSLKFQNLTFQLPTCIKIFGWECILLGVSH